MVNYFTTKIQEHLRLRREKKRYYHDEIFADLDEQILSGPNPFKVSKRYLQQLGEEDVYQYGETPLETMEEIGKMLDLHPADHCLELGCGRGRVSFFLSRFFGCQVTGVDCIPDFILRAKAIKAKNVSFRCENMFKTDLKGISHIYLYGTCLDDLDIERLAVRFAKYPLKIATTSYPIPEFTIIDQKELTFPWGKTEVYINSTCPLSCQEG